MTAKPLASVVVKTPVGEEVLEALFVLLIVELLRRVGSVAPHGLFAAQSD